MKRHLVYLFSSALFIATASTASALNFSTLVKDDATASYTKCAWESDPHINKVLLKGKPGRNDTLYIHTDKKFTIDAPVAVANLRILYKCNVIADNKKIDLLKGPLHMEFAGGADSTNVLTLTRSQVNSRGALSFSIWEKCKGMGSCKVSLIDSKIDVRNGITFICPAYYVKPVKNRSGAEIELTGASCITSKGEILLDSILTSTPDMHFRFTFNDKDGKVPFVSVKSGSIGGAELRVNIKGKLKKGIYPLIDFTGSKAPEGSLRAVYLNGKEGGLGASTTVEGRTVTVKLGSADGKKANDYILEVK